MRLFLRRALGLQACFGSDGLCQRVLEFIDFGLEFRNASGNRFELRPRDALVLKHRFGSSGALTFGTDFSPAQQPRRDAAHRKAG